MDKTLVGIVLFFLLFGGLVYLASNAKDQKATNNMTGNIQISLAPQNEESNQGQVQGDTDEKDTKQSGGEQTMDNPQGANLKIEDITVGNGAEAQAGKSVTVQYTGTLTDGTKFDSSYDHGQPFTFNLGAGQVIQGWDQGVSGMKVGGKRKLTIPPSLGYGERAVGGIPANSTLIFEVELLDVK